MPLDGTVDNARQNVLPATELAPGLHSVGGLIPFDTRLSWAPPQAHGLQPVNAYVLVTADETPLLIDTGLAGHEAAVVAGLASLVLSEQPIAAFLTRSEYECSGNLGTIVRRFTVRTLYTGGVANPFDAFDELASAHDLWSNRVRLGRIRPGDYIPLEACPRVSILAAPIRILATYWAYDSETKTLFTSDAFGHAVLASANESAGPVTDPDAFADPSWVKDNLLAKFAWLRGAEKVGAVREHLERIGNDLEIRNIAPTHGRVFVGGDIAQAQFQLMVDVLRGLEAPRRPRPPSGDRPSAADRPRAGNRRPGPKPTIPRQLAPGVHWLGSCIEGGSVMMRGTPHHSHLSNYLIVGDDQSLIVDTGMLAGWPKLQHDLAAVLDHRPLDWIFPTHPEYPHSGNLERLMEQYPTAVAVGDVRDYHVFFPASAGRTRNMSPYDVLDLGGGYEVEFLPAVLHDLPSTQWLYERKTQTLFVADGFGFFHREPDGDDDEATPTHSPGECALLVSEVEDELKVEQAEMIVANALSWSRFADSARRFEEFDRLVSTRPIRLVAPAHGNVIDNLDEVLPLIRQSHAAAYALT
jgi:flavorubredoxin